MSALLLGIIVTGTAIAVIKALQSNSKQPIPVRAKKDKRTR